MINKDTQSVEQLSSSLRVASLEESLRRAKSVAEHYGITRVTDITQLDKVGIPVFASIRPEAEENSLCVHAGKGFHREEARVGAYMEAIEFAAAEFKRRIFEVFDSTPRKLANQPAFQGRFVDLCPLLGCPIDPDAAITCCAAEDIITGERIGVPAELVFFPFNENPGQRIFGSSTNGLCSGNSVDEATLHGICEVLERDIQAYNFVRDSSALVMPPYEPSISSLISRIDGAGLDWVLRFTSSDHGIPYFQAFILEPSDDDPIAISHGTGCHPVRAIAAVRALTEAAQSRLSYIHGGRDDLIERARFFAAQAPLAEIQETARMRARVHSREREISYHDIPDLFADLDQPPRYAKDALHWLAERLAKCGFKQVLRIVLAPLEHPAVIRVIVPGAESFEPSLKRAGPRLQSWVGAIQI